MKMSKAVDLIVVKKKLALVLCIDCALLQCRNDLYHDRISEDLNTAQDALKEGCSSISVLGCPDLIYTLDVHKQLVYST